VVAQALAWGQLLIIPLDVSTSTEIDSGIMNIIYNVVYWSIFFISVFVIPFATGIYESGESDSMLSRVCWSFVYALVISIVFSAIIFISYIWLGIAYVVDANGIITEERLEPGLYLMVCLEFLGWILLAINGGIGLIYIPHDLILSFVKRPR
jgi:hypothetical protein